MTVQKVRLILVDEAKKIIDEDILEIISILDFFVKCYLCSMESERLNKYQAFKKPI